MTKAERMDDENNKEILSLAKQLVADIEAGNTSSVPLQLEELARWREDGLYQELGKLTRQLHESLNNFQVDSKISFLAENEIPDAKARLSHVITMTEDSAHKTMNAVESAMPLSQDLEASAHRINNEWKRFRNRELSADDFRSMSKTLDDFFPEIAKTTCDINSYMTEIMMAQDFQDLTGQIIRRVINLVQEVEESLVELVKISGKPVAAAVEAKAETSGSESETSAKTGDNDTVGHGPQIPGVDHGSTVNGQDDVDELLSSLGF